MQSYKDLNNDSGVSAYELRADSIVVEFDSGARYLYTYGSAGSANIEHMKKLAAAGDGLNSFIMRNVKKLYESKLN